MNLKQILCLFFSLVIMSCGCDDEGYELFELNNYEKNVIPFDHNTTAEFIDNNSLIVNSTITGKISETVDLNSSDDESCFSSLVEYIETSYQFDNCDNIYFVRVDKSRSNTTGFIIYSLSRDYYSIDNIYTQNLEEELIDVSIDGFDYFQVFFLSSINPETEFEAIIYSPQNGIEFIKYRNGNYLKLND